jgi:hypothetical protein
MSYTVPAGRYGDTSTAFIQAYIDQAIAGVIELAPETLNSLNELAAAINDDPAFYATVAAQVSELNTDVTDLVAALGIAENDSDVGTFTSPTLPDGTTLRAVLEAFATAYDTTKSNLESADTALSGRIDTLEADPTTATALAAVQADVDQNESDCDAADSALSGRLDTLEADPTTKTYVDTQDAATLAAANTYTDTELTALIDGAPGVLDTLKELSDSLGGDADFVTTMTDANNALDARLDTLEADPTTQTLLDAEETARENADTALSGRLDVLEADPTTQALLDAEATTRGNADTALSGRLDVLEADPTTAAAVAAVQADVDQNESDADAAIALKLDIADPAATGELTVDTNAKLEFDSNLTKLHNVLRGTYINIGNNIELRPAAAGGRVEITGDLLLDASDLVNANNDTDAAAGGTPVGGIYHHNGAVRIRLS